MGNTPVTLDFSKAQPVDASSGQSPVSLDFSKAQPVPSEVNGKEGFWHSFSAFLPGYHENDPLGALKDFAEGVKDMATKPGASASVLYHGVVDPMQQTAESGLARMKQPGIGNKIAGGAEWLESGIPILGPVLAKAGHQFESGDVAGGAGTMTGAALPVVMPEAAKVPGAIAEKISATGLPERMYQSALKPGPGSYSTSQVASMVKTGLENRIPVSAAGAERLANLVDDLNSKIKAQIDAGNTAGATVNKFAVARNLSQTAQKFRTQVAPEADLNAIAETGNEFLRNQPSEIPLSTAQALKQGTYQQLKSKAYGELKSATVESQKALARGLKDEIASQFPEISTLNAQESKLINLDGALEHAVRRIDNHQMLGIGTPIAAGAAGAVTKSTGIGVATGILKAVFDDPMLKSKLAIAMRRAGVNPVEASSRLNAYAAALANAGTSQPGGNQ